jgi:hypothetical protein
MYHVPSIISEELTILWCGLLILPIDLIYIMTFRRLVFIIDKMTLLIIYTCGLDLHRRPRSR